MSFGLLAGQKEYFDTDEGKKTLAELFDGRPQLLIYRLMFGPTYAAACPAARASLTTWTPHSST